jgi:lysozyme family protein
MPSAALSSALPFVLRWEGGFVDHPADPGGRTNKGVTQKVYNASRARLGLAPQDVKNITDTEVHAIYEADYWIPPRCDLLEDSLSLVQFDTAVNMGVGRAVRLLQGAAGCGVDGDFGPGTRKAVTECDAGQLLVRYCDAREAFYRRLAEKKPELAVFLKGWLNRLNALRKEIGLPGFESAAPLDFGATGYIKKIPEGAEYDL